MLRTLDNIDAEGYAMPSAFPKGKQHGDLGVLPEFTNGEVLQCLQKRTGTLKSKGFVKAEPCCLCNVRDYSIEYLVTIILHS